jgi:flagellar hook-basal body complex protein FliE
MSVLPVAAVSAVTPTTTLQQTAATTDDSTGAGFSSVLSGIEQVQQLQSTTDSLAVQAVTGDLDDVHDYTIAAAESSTALELTAALRNKAVDAFTEIMRMQA